MTKYLILSLSHSTKTQPCWWRENCAGHTNYVVSAGKYTAEEINSDPDYYNNGRDTMAIPMTEAGFASIGFTESFNVSMVRKLADALENEKKEVQP
jgi:hypothetical protein